MAVVGRQFGTNPLAIGRRSLADVHRDVEDATSNASHQLVLPVRRRLIVQAPQRVGWYRKRVIVPHEIAGDAQFGEVSKFIHFGKPTTCIAVAGGADQLNDKMV